MTRPIPLTLACCLLSACAAGPLPTPEPKVPPPANLIAPPPVLPPPLSGAMRDLEANHRQVARSYHQVAARYCGLLAWLGITLDECGPFTDQGGAP